MHRSLPFIAGWAVAFSSCADRADSAPSEPSPGDIVFNELNATGTAEWLELYDAGDHDLDLAGYGVADSDKNTGLARTTKAMHFPPGTVLRKHGFALVLLGKNDAAPGPYPAAACLPEVDSACFYAAFSISAARGETVHVLAPDDTTLVSVTYPADLIFDPSSGSSACRIPDGAGALTTCSATPSATNAAP